MKSGLFGFDSQKLNIDHERLTSVLILHQLDYLFNFVWFEEFFKKLYDSFD
jgi:hypothetical protein